MAQPYVGEIRLFAGTFAPAGWAFCDGQLLPISENETLFQLIGTTYGGDGQSTFALPNMQGRLPVHFGNGPSGTNYQLAEMGGTESVTLTIQQIPSHNHPARCRDAAGASTADPLNATWTHSDSPQYNNPSIQASPGPPPIAAGQPPNASMGNPPIQSSVEGGSQPHDNMIPFLCINYIISLFGLFPSPT